MTQSAVSNFGARAARLGAWFDRNGGRLGLLTTGLLVGMVAGWWAGSFLSCSSSVAGCEARPDSIGAAGTWFGSIGTIAAVLTAVAAFRSDEKAKREAARRALLTDEAKERLYFEEAALVTVSCKGYHTQADKVRSYSVTVTNGADTTPIYRLAGRDFSGDLKREHMLLAGKSSMTDRRMGSWTAPADKQERHEFEPWCLESVTITFKMNDRYWRRRGTGAVEPIRASEAEQ